MRARTIFPLLAALVLCTGMASAQVLINELDSDTASTDVLEFVELYGPANTPLDGLVLVFWNGSTDVSYAAYDLDGYSLNANGYFLLGNALVVPTPSIIFADNFLQNGADAVALYAGNGADFPNSTPLTLTNLIDAVVYDTDDADDAGLLTLLLPGEPQINENQNGLKDYESIFRCLDGAGGARVTSSMNIGTPTPLAANQGTCPPEEQACCFADGTCQDLLEADCLAAGGEVYAGTCATVTCPTPPVEMSLCDAIQDDPNGDPLYFGTRVHITSPLLVLNDHGVYTATSVDCGATDGICCVNLFDFNNTTVLMAGDLVDVIGDVNRYNGKAELTGLELTVISSGNPLPPPEEITAEELFVNGELYESCLISICGLQLADPSQWPLAGANANVNVFDDTGYIIQLRVDKETDIDGTAVPIEPFTCIGLGCQFDNATPYFDGYQILPRMRADILDGIDCPQAVQACCFPDGNCIVLTPADCEQAGGAVYPDPNCDGQPCPQPPAEFACCFADGSCQVLTEEACLAAGGTVYFDYPNCDSQPCPQPPAEYACCFPDGSCQVLTEEACVAAGGTVYAVAECTPELCPMPLGACCLPDCSCVVLVEAECLAQQGIWHANDDCAEPTPCAVTPAVPDTWGAIKSVYR